MPIRPALARDGAYHWQFVTGTGNGGLTARPGGDRWRWESRIFGGAAYGDADPSDQPVYAALNFRRQTVGAAPALRLRPLPPLRHDSRCGTCSPASAPRGVRAPPRLVHIMN